MFGHLPLRHTILVAGLLVLVGIVTGTWLGSWPGMPFHAGTGALVGVALGLVAAAAVLHLHHLDSRPGGPHASA
jgi:hypothetical protein